MWAASSATGSLPRVARSVFKDLSSEFMRESIHEMSSLIHDRQSSNDSITKHDVDDVDEYNPRELDADIRNSERPESRRLTPADKKTMLTKALEIDPGVEVWSWRGIQNLLILLTVAFCPFHSMYP